MTAIRSSARAGIFLLAVLCLAKGPSAWAEPAEPVATANDVARFLSGLEPSGGSPLAPLTRDRAWQHHARSLDAAWTRLERQRLSKIRAWSAAHLTEPRPAVLYMFSGPDFLYVGAFFPDRTTYVLSGLEPVGEVPAITPSLRRSLAPALAGLRESVGSALSYSFFITREMKRDLRASRLNGVLPVLYLFLARSGKTVHEVALIGIDKEGAVVAAGSPDTVPGVKIVFSGREGRMQTLYYFQTDLSDHGLKRTGFLKFCEKLGIADAFIKSASYLLHSGNFARLRGFLLERTMTLVQDDSGIPVHYFKADEWRLRPFGRYLGPISVFPRRYQRALGEIYRRSSPPRLEFGVGYRWRPHESNLLLAVRSAKDGLAQESGRQR
jgi:hypothetical protein